MDCVDELFSIDKDSGRSMRGMTALVLGAGGVSRAIAWGLKQRNADVIISSRTLERSQILAAEIGCRAIEWEFRHDHRINLLVNGTPVGMHPDVDSSPYNASAMNQYLAVFDTVYNPENTLLIKAFKTSPMSNHHRHRHVRSTSRLSIQTFYRQRSALRTDAENHQRCYQPQYS